MYESVAEFFDGEEDYNAWLKKALREEVKRRQLEEVRNQADQLIQNAAIVIPSSLL